MRSRARRAERARVKADAQLTRLRRRPDIRVTNAVAPSDQAMGRSGSARFRTGDRTESTAPDRRLRAPVEEAALLKGSPVFDLAWYEQEAGRSFSGLDEAVAHYRKQGAARQLSPHPLFAPPTASNSTTGVTPVGAYLISPPRGLAVAPPRLGRRGLPPPRARRRPTQARSARPPRGAAHRRDRARHPRSDRSDPGALGRGAGLAGRGLGLDGAAAADASDRTPRSRPTTSALRDLAPVEHTPETLVSIVIPTWNRSGLLRRALASVRDQTWSHWEALVVDDGSEDDTREVVAALAEQDPRIRLVVRPHEGVCAARNAGLAEARGGFIAFLDSDNEWMPRLPRDDGAA